MTDTITRVAMWSGPRNISTAMMRSWENRADTFVTDEPFYAYYLNATRIEHPGIEEIIASQSTDWRQVATDCVSKTDSDHAVHYQKHMTQHMLEEIDLNFLVKLKNIFLIRSPEEVVASYSKTRSNPTPEDLGFAQQHRLFKFVQDNVESKPLVITARQVLSNPAATLEKACVYCGLEFDEDMLHWSAGRRESDGVWAPHWYANVEKSTSFAPYVKRHVKLDYKQREIADRCSDYYQAMLAEASR